MCIGAWHQFALQHGVIETRRRQSQGLLMGFLWVDGCEPVTKLNY